MKFETKKGISILLSVFILSFVLSIALGTSVVLIRQVKTMRDVGFSVIAFYAADHGIEEVLASEPPLSIPETDLDGSGTKYEVFVEAGGTGDCDSQWNFCLKSIGIYRGVRRAIEVKY